MDKHCIICHNKSCSNHGKNISFLGDGWKCNYIPVPTNADKIRTMSNENLAYILGKFCKEMAYCIVCPLYGSGCPMSSNFNDWVKWLQQPVEGE